MLVPARPPPPVNPDLLRHAEERAKNVREEDRQNEELLHVTKQILKLTKEVRSMSGVNRPAERG